MDKILLLNTEYKLNNNITAVTLVNSSTNEDIAKGLISDGLLLVLNQRDRRLIKLVNLCIFIFIYISTSQVVYM